MIRSPREAAFLFQTQAEPRKLLGKRLPRTTASKSSAKSRKPPNVKESAYSSFVAYLVSDTGASGEREKLITCFDFRDTLARSRA